MNRIAFWTFAVLAVIPATARATFVVNIVDVGGDVVATGSGSIDLTDLRSVGFANASEPSIEADLGAAVFGPGLAGPEYLVSGPTQFGTGRYVSGSTGVGDAVGIFGTPVTGLPSRPAVLALPAGYVSGAPLSNVTTWKNRSVTVGLGLNPGVYTWRVGGDFFVMNVVPEPGSATLLGGAIGAAGLAAWVRRRRRTVRA